MPRELLTMTGTYAQFEGTNIVAENCLGAKVRDLVIEGKTYQNLFKATLNQGGVGNAPQLNDSRVNSENFYLKVGKYTIIMPDENMEIALYPNYLSSSSSFITWANCIVWDNTSEGNDIKLVVRKKSQSNITVDEVTGKIILLEGDYTNIDLPDSIDGIESVTERENNILSIKINDYIVSNINLPIPLRSLPNGTCDTIENNQLIQRVGKIVIDGTQSFKLNNVNQSKTTRCYFTLDNANISKGNNNLMCNWYIREGKHGDYEYIIIQSIAEETSNTVFISVLNSKLETTDVNGMKKYFSENPLPVYYELTTPITHSLEIPSINTVSKTNTITTNNNIKPVISCKLKLSKANITS